jgi:mRNA interferase MazF
VWWVDLGEPAGSAPAFVRPALVVSSDAFNRSEISTVCVVVITSNLALAAAPGNVRLNRREAGLPKASVLNVSQVATVDKAGLVNQIGRLSAARLAQVDVGLRLAMSL